MSKAEKAAIEHGYKNGSYPEYSADTVRQAFISGYHQAEKDLELTVDNIANILDITDVIANDDSMEKRLKTMSEEEYYQEVLKRFKERKEK